MQQQIIKETFQLVSKRDDNVCNFLEGGRLVTILRSLKCLYKFVNCIFIAIFLLLQFDWWLGL